ncbi:NrfD/PsrC family molybdoenzyme membrane anchor subunit [Streptacidiphilus griseoplanus]|uniref:NrfD/PsrC family molybdoenzyme membrane anchor subunit n=1 Tax=Peterkaempfera griseoplana TaxID=66896 RepID=UPI0006E1DF6D|nr:NrfD/PsrC family molybdoenzyme membrane anchor subunit [Peterkaempfera griseoplana]
MSSSDVTREGLRGVRPGREAETGAGVGRGRDRRRRGGRAEQPMVPQAEFTSYYGRPVLKPPGWKPLNIAGYFFLGGLAGAGSVLAAGAQLTGRPVTARAMKLSSLAAVSGSAAALVHDLGRPGRFANMLRVLKPTSPMSVGSWLLAAYGPAAGAAALLDRAPAVVPLPLRRAGGAAATAAAALLGPAVAAYTAVLAADTAVPAWHDGHRELPFVFVGSAAAAAAGMAMVVAPVAENGPARSTAVLGAAVENAATALLEHRIGVVAETYRQGTAGRLMRASQVLSAVGAAGALFGGRSRAVSAAGGVALLAASACTRFGVFHAGLESAKDPKYTVLPQRERLGRRRAGQSGARGRV